MTDIEYHRSRYDAPKPKGFLGVPPGVLLVSVIVVSILFSILAFYFINAQFKLREVNYSDDSVGTELLSQIGNKTPSDERIFIRADQTTRYGDFMQVMNSLQDSGFYSVALVGEEQTTK